MTRRVVQRKKLCSILLCILLITCLVSWKIPLQVEAADKTVVDTINIKHIHTGSPETGGGCYSVNTSTSVQVLGDSGAQYRNPGTKLYNDAGACIVNFGTINTTGYDKLVLSYGLADLYGFDDWRPMSYNWVYVHIGFGLYNTLLFHGCKVGSGSTTYGLTQDSSGVTWDVSAMQGAYSLIAYATSDGNHAYYNARLYSATLVNISYGLGCGHTENDNISSIDMVKTIENGNYILTPTVKSSDSIYTNATYKWNTGESGPCNVTGNNTYTLTISYQDSGIQRTKTCVYNITDFDMVPPTISCVARTTTPTNQDVIIDISASDAETGILSITLPDASSVSSESTTYKVSENGTYLFKATDKAGNVTTQKVNITNIDKVLPSVNVTYDKSLKTSTILITVVATDDDSGLQEQAYSYDGGMNWEVSNQHSYSGNGTYNIVTRDKAGNIAYTKITLDTIVSASVNAIENVIATQTVRITATVKNSTAVTWVRQPNNGDAPDENAWEELDTSNAKYITSIAKSETNENGSWDATVVLQIITDKEEDNGNWYYGIRAMAGPDELTKEGEQAQTPVVAYNTVSIIPIKIVSIDVTAPFTSIEAGNTIYPSDMMVVATFNLGTKEAISENAKYADLIYFLDGDGKAITSVTPVTVTSGYKIPVHVEKDGGFTQTLSFDVIDTTKPKLLTAAAFHTEPGLLIQRAITFQMTATDNSDSPLYYKVDYTAGGTTISSGWKDRNEITLNCTNNGFATIYVKDASGNTTEGLEACAVINLHFYDTEPPTITSVNNTPELGTITQKFHFTVTATDDSDESYLIYQFYMNGTLIQSGPSKDCDITENGELKISVSDYVGNHTDWSKTYLIDSVDTEPPVIGDVKMNVVGDLVTATVIATDNVTEAETLSYGMSSYSGTYTQQNNVFNILSNGTYTFAVTDQAENVTTTLKSINVNSLLSTSYLYSIIEDVTMTPLGNAYFFGGITYSDGNVRVTPVIATEAEKDNLRFSYTLKGAADDYSTATSFQASTNGTYVVKVRDLSKETTETGEVVYEAEVVISGIDKEIPVVTATTGSTTATLSGTDNLSGIGRVLVTRTAQDGTKTETTTTYLGVETSISKTIQMDATSGYSYMVLDNVGNSTGEKMLREVVKDQEENAVHYVWACFVDWDYSAISIQKIEYGSVAVAPTDPGRKGYTFVGWNKPFTNLTQEVTYLYAQYSTSHKLSDSETLEPPTTTISANSFSFSNELSGTSVLRTDVALINKTSLSASDITLGTKEDVTIDSEKVEELAMVDLAVPIVGVASVLVIAGTAAALFVKKKGSEGSGTEV